MWRAANAMRGFFNATRHATSLLKPSISHLWVAGGGIFAKTAKTPPLQSGICEEGVAEYLHRSAFTPCGH